MAKMRQVLLKRRDALRKVLAGDSSLLRELREQSSGDVVDFAQDSAHDEISSQLAEVESRELASVEAALEKMRNGSYGKCEGCSEDIPLVRLQALPVRDLLHHLPAGVGEERGSQSDCTGLGDDILDSSGGDSETVLSDLELDVS